MVGDEVIRAATTFANTNGTEAIVVTDKNFYSFEPAGILASKSTTISLSKISGCEISGFTGMKLAITEGTLKHQYKNVSNSKTIVEAIRSSDGAVEQTEPAKAEASVDPTEELRKYKALLDDGIITQEDFDKKKNILLGL